ncbi:glycoside hydrolase family 97 C-terminal domain-containing protein [Streptomyces sp. NPDC051636]|uniref:glycoside hydrolase family 97 C-terminal domain-containing protein n=1 Tax=Streptomyces sp. NPDC051636 TaxID=3365663 RepID=UPI00379D9EBF
MIRPVRGLTPSAPLTAPSAPSIPHRTRLLTGDPGRSAVPARRSADGRWFVGGTFAGAAHTADVPLRLGAGRRLVETLTDGPSGLVRTTHAVRAGATLSVPVITDGGFAALACRWHEGRTTCER